MDIWLFWDNPPEIKSTPVFIELCWETIHKHCGKDFDIHLVTTENAQQFLPNIPKRFFQIKKLNNKANYIRYLLLKEYGGIWLDSDLILFRSLKPLLSLIKNDINLIATASMGLRSGEPENGFLISTPGSKIMAKSITLVEYALELHPPGYLFKWGSLGVAVLRQVVKNNKYHHLDPALLMPIPSWEAHRFDSKESIDRCCTKESYGCMLFHEMFKQSNSPILQMNRQQLLESTNLIGQLFRRAMSE